MMKPIDVTGYEEPICLLSAEVVKPFETLVVKARTKITLPRPHLKLGTLESLKASGNPKPYP